MRELGLINLLKPIPGDRPAGDDLRYTSLYDQIKEARRADDGLAQGAWKRERKVADYRLVIRLTTQALGEKSKDLQLAAWLSEALIREHGFAGLHAGLELCLGLLDRYWDGLHPALEDGDAELRAAPLAWMASQLGLTAKAVPVVADGYDWFAYGESRAVGYDSSAATPEQKKAREKAIGEGRLSAEAFDKAFVETPRSFYLDAERSLTASLTALDALDELCAARFGDAAPGFGKLREAMAEVQHTVHVLLQKRAEPEVEDEEPALLANSAPGESAPAIADVSAVPELNGRIQTDSFGAAMQAMRAGQQQQALQMLSRDLATQSSGRGRFLRRLELARLCIAAGKDAVAQPLLDDLASTIENHRLEEWEEHETVAAALVTILQASTRIQADAKEKQKLFERICRLDPSQALGC